MVLTFALLQPDELAQARALLAEAQWIDGRGTAGPQAGAVKNNQQLAADSAPAQALRALVLRALERTPAFLSAALPARLVPPQFNRYAPAADRYGRHVDNAVRFLDGGVRVRCDLSCTVFLNGPQDYDGGELCLFGPQEERRIRLAAGHAVLYEAGCVHEVLPVTRGERLGCFFWVQSLVADPRQRRLLLDLDQTLAALRQRHGESDLTLSLTASYHRLLQMWAHG